MTDPKLDPKPKLDDMYIKVFIEIETYFGLSASDEANIDLEEFFCDDDEDVLERYEKGEIGVKELNEAIDKLIEDEYEGFIGATLKGRNGERLWAIR